MLNSSKSPSSRAKWDAIYAHQHPQYLPNQWLVNVLSERITPESNVVELGAGRGALALEIAHLGANITAVDISGEAIAAMTPHPRLRAVQLDLESAEFSADALGVSRIDILVAHRYFEPRVISALFPLLSDQAQVIIKTFDERVLETKPHFNRDWIIKRGMFKALGFSREQWFEDPQWSNESAVIASV